MKLPEFICFGKNKKTLSKAAKRNKLKRNAWSVTRFLFLLSLSYIVIFQLCYMVISALKPVPQNTDPSVVWVPKSITWKNVADAIEVMDFWNSLSHTVLILVVSALIEVVVCSVVAYGFARFKFPEKNIVFFLVMVTIIVPPQMIMAPTYLNYSQLDFLGIFGVVAKWTGIDIRPNIIDTPWTFYLPSIFGVGLRSGLFIYIYKQFFKGLPTELEEAAWVDGAGPLRTYISIIVPSSGVAFLTVTVFSLIWHWNDFYSSSMYLTEMATLATKLSNVDANMTIIGLSDSNNVRMAACVIFILPVLIAYMFLQKKFIKSIDRVGIVG